MEIRLRLLFLIPILALALQGCGIFGKKHSEPPLGAEAAVPVQETSEQQVINPEVQRRQVKVPSIPSQDFEIGPYLGLLSIEDFGTHSVTGVRLAYHVTEDLFFEGLVNRSKGGRTSEELILGGAQILTPSEREYTSYSLSIGWDTLPGEIFVGKNRTYNTALYLVAGIGSTKFAGDSHFTANGAIGYRILLTSWLAAHIEFRDSLFDIDVLGPKKVDQNLEGTLGLTVYF